MRSGLTVTGHDGLLQWFSEDMQQSLLSRYARSVCSDRTSTLHRNIFSFSMLFPQEPQ